MFFYKKAFCCDISMICIFCISFNQKVGDETAKTYDEEMRRKRGTIPSPDTIAYINKLPKRIKVPTKEEMQYIRAANEPLPDHNARSKYSVDTATLL